MEIPAYVPPAVADPVVDQVTTAIDQATTQVDPLPQDPPIVDPTPADPPPSDPPRTFTQDELNAIIAKEKAKAERRLQREYEAKQAKPAEFKIESQLKREDFKDDEAFGQALVLEQAKRLNEHERQHSGIQEKINNFRALEDDFAEKEPAYHAKINEASKHFTPAMNEALLELDNGPEIAYYLANNPQELDRIKKLSPARAAVEIGILKATKKDQVKPVSAAPAPIKPAAQGSGSGAVKVDTTDPESLKNLSTKEWIRLENARKAALRKQGR